MNKFLSVFFISANFLGVFAQNEGPYGYFNDALLLSQTDNLLGSTARMQGIMGAQTALGGDISSITANPAGLGFFNQGAFAFTPSIDFINSESRFQIPADEYSSEDETSFKTNFNLANFGMVIHLPAARFGSGGWKGSALGVSLNRLSSYHLNRSYEGINDFNSVADSWAIEAGQAFPEDLPEYSFAAYDQYLISPLVDENGDIVEYVADFDGYPVQNESIKERGSNYQLNVAWGGNYADFLYFGGGLGVQIMNYSQERTFRESDFAFFDDQGEFVPDTRLNAINLSDELTIRGAGVNFNAGVVLRPLNFWTIGASYTSPSFLALDDESFFDLSADWSRTAYFDDETPLADIEEYESDIFFSNYSLRTPSKVSVGSAIFLGKLGFISADLERVDYANAVISSEDFSENADNDLIESIYSEVINMKFGAELRFGHVRLRSGYAIYPSPYRNSNFEDQTAISAGLGYRNQDFFIDLAVIQRNRSVAYQPYNAYSEFQPEVISEVTNTTASLTFGFNF